MREERGKGRKGEEGRGRREAERQREATRSGPRRRRSRGEFRV